MRHAEDVPRIGRAARADGKDAGVVRVRLPSDPASAGRARRVLRQALVEAGREAWLDAAELACSEIVSNAILHAHTPIELAVIVTHDALRVEVRDFSPALPVQRSYTGEATTGRGMALVAALVHEHGIDHIDGVGKTVWFTITNDLHEQTEGELLAAWADSTWNLDDILDAAPAPEDAIEVVLLGLPPTLWLASRQHHDALIRELQLYLAEHQLAEVDVPATDRARATVSTAVVAAVERAQTSGTARSPLPEGHPSPLPAVPAPLALDLKIPRDLGAAFAAMQDTLDAAERLAQDGLLLVRPGLPEIIAVRDWACEQITAQLAGVPPSPWPGTDQEQFTKAADRHGGQLDVPGWDPATVLDAERGVVAADDANRILAVSRAFAELVGWPVVELVGRRVVTLVPPHLREAHVAGFTRHLTTGETHALNVPLRLPVLHRDGHEIPCSFLVQLAPTTAGRPVYLAWIEAAD